MIRASKEGARGADEGMGDSEKIRKKFGVGFDKGKTCAILNLTRLERGAELISIAGGRKFRKKSKFDLTGRKSVLY